ncbi:MAG: hypothetical protein WDO19_03490 [Bacteroidota bacterium]
MKKILLMLCIASFAVHAAYSQSVLDQAKSAAGSAGFDVKSLTDGILGILKPKLALTDAQTPKVTSAVTTFLDAKSKILPLLTTNKTAYNQKQASLFSKLKTALATTLVKNQVSKFLGLKPATNDATNVLSNLFY